MNPTLIKKDRSGGFLLNQQINKSNINKYDKEGRPIESSGEADGTIIAFRYSKDINLDILNNLKTGKHFGKDWELYLDEYSNSDTVDSINFLTFNSEPTECLDDSFKLKDRLFIDHSPVQMSLESIQMLTGKQTSSQWKNLIALNLGSIINSGDKDWNLDKISVLDKIIPIDKTLFKKVRNALTSDETALTSDEDENGNDYPYESFNGQAFGELSITNKNVNEVASAMLEADKALTCLRHYHRGGKSKPKSKPTHKFKYRISKTKKIKRKTKRIRKQYKY